MTFYFVDAVCYILCESCYEERSLTRPSPVQPISETETSLALPPLTMSENDGALDLSSTSCTRDVSVLNFLREGSGQSNSNPDTFCGLLPYLGLKERKPYPNPVIHEENDPLGVKVVDKVSGIKHRGTVCKITDSKL